MRIIVFFLLVVSPSTRAVYASLEELLRLERFVRLLPEHLSEDETVYAPADLNELYTKRFADFDAFIQPEHREIMQMIVKMALEIAVRENEIIPYYHVVSPKRKRPKLITIKEYLGKVPPGYKALERKRLADIITKNTFSIEYLLYEIFKRNQEKFSKDITHEKYQLRMAQIPQLREEFLTSVREALETLS